MLGESAPAVERGFRAPGTTMMIAGSLIGAVGAYLFQVIGGRALGPDGFAPISALWTVFFILVTVVLVPLEQYVTREASRGREVLSADRRPIVLVTLGAAFIGAVFTFLTRDSLFGGDAMFALQAGLVMFGYGVLLVGKGILAGHRRFAGVGWILVYEAALRLALGIAIIWIIPTASALAWAMVVAPFAALAVGFWRHDRATSGAEATGAAGFLGAYITGSAASQVLLAGAPLAVAALGGSPSLVSIVFVTFTLYRGPLTLIYALQGRILPYLVSMTTDNSHGLRRMAGMVIGGGAILAALGGLVGWLVGPEVVGMLFGREFMPDRLAAALIAAGVVAASTTQVAGQVLVARGRTGLLAGAWIAGLVIALGSLMVLTLTPDRTVAGAFMLGELGATVVLAALTLRAPKTT